MTLTSNRMTNSLPCLVLGTTIAGMVASLVGCGDSSQPVSSQSSQLEPESSSDRDAETAGLPPAVPDDADAAVPEAADEGRPDQPELRVAQRSPAGVQPTVTPSGDYQVPEGTPEQLLAFINQLAQQNPRGANEQERMQDIGRIMQARLLAAEKIITAKPEEKYLRAAVETKLESLRAMAMLEQPNAEANCEKYAQSLLKSSTPSLRSLGQVGSFQLRLDRFMKNPGENPAPIVEAVQTLLAAPDRGEEILAAAGQAAGVLEQAGHAQQSIDVLMKTTAAYKDHPDPQLVEKSLTYADHAELISYQEKLAAVLQDEKDAIPTLLKEIQRMLSGAAPSGDRLAAVMEGAQLLEFSGYLDAAKKVYGMASAAYKQLPDAQLKKEGAAAIASAAKRIGLVGKPFPIEGVMADGTPFTWNDYRGKVVLVDFWATWCGPCLNELPNIRKNFEKFRAQGFEVVGINLDDDPQKVQNFLSSQQLPWATVFSAGDKTGFENPNAVRCGVEAIPFIVLVDRQGNVAALHVRGPQLEKKLTEMLGAPSDPGTGARTGRPARAAARDGANPVR